MEFNLSEKRKELIDEVKLVMQDHLGDVNLNKLLNHLRVVIREHDLEFIKLLKTGLLINGTYHREINRLIDKLAGDKLI